MKLFYLHECHDDVDLKRRADSYIWYKTAKAFNVRQTLCIIIYSGFHHNSTKYDINCQGNINYVSRNIGNMLIGKVMFLSIFIRPYRTVLLVEPVQYLGHGAYGSSLYYGQVPSPSP